eukprot:jgi/Ulvmu1/4299/UM002_0020.1
MRDPVVADAGLPGPTDAPSRGVKRSFEQALPAVATPGHPSISPRCSSPCPTIIDAPTGVRADSFINADACRSALGDRTFAILRTAMLQQQEIFLEQLWELHKLARTQGRKAAVLATDAQLAPVPGEAPEIVLNPKEQLHLHQMTMQAILGMQTIPASLRRPVVVPNPDPPKTAAEPVVTEQIVASKAPPAGTHAAPATAQVLSHQPLTDLSNAAFPGPLMMCPVGGVPYGQQSISCPLQAGYGLHDDPSAVSLHWPGGPRYPGAALPTFHPGALRYGNVPPAAAQFLQGLPSPSGPLSHCAPAFAAAHAQGGGPGSGNHQSPAQLQSSESQPRPMDVSSLLGMVAPGISAQPDLHSHWFAKNMAGASAPQDMSAALLGMKSTMDAAEPPVADIGFAGEAARSNLSTSMWSGNTLVMSPSMAPVQEQIGQLGDKGVPNAMPAAKAQTPASGSGLVADPARVSDAAGTHSVEMGAFHKEPAGKSVKDAGNGRTCQTDESAASILMSLKASS